VPLVVVLFLALTVYLGLKYARSRGLSGDDAARWAFAALIAIALVLVLSRLGKQWAAGALAIGVGLAWWLLPRLLIKANKPPPVTSSQMSRSEALEVLGLSATASDSEIAQEYRRLIKQLHPDRGGSKYLAARVNEARRVLLGR
jgi:hypothetical protein